MRKYLNTLFITSQGAYLSKEGETVVVSMDKEKKTQVPIHTLGGIVCFGQVGMSPFLMGLCAENNVAVSFLSERGRFLASVQGMTRGNVILRRNQYRRADDSDYCAGIAKLMITGKIANCRAVINRAIRDHEDKLDGDILLSAAKRLDGCLEQLMKSASIQELRGIEGESAKIYFSIFDQLIVAQKDRFRFDERNRRPPRDTVNCLLSFIYTLLMHDVRAALETVGLDSCVGFLHTDKPGRPSLALDMMEEFRPFVADRLVLSLINREQVRSSGFMKSETGAVLMDDETRKSVIVAYQKRKQEEIKHPYLKESAPLGLMFFLQALLLARHLRGDIDGYPVFIWK